MAPSEGMKKLPTITSAVTAARAKPVVWFDRLGRTTGRAGEYPTQIFLKFKRIAK